MPFPVSSWVYVLFALLLLLLLFRFARRKSERFTDTVTKRLEAILAEHASEPIAQEVQVFVTPFFAQQKEKIAAELAATAESRRLPLLIEQLAEARCRLRWEHVYYRIYASQISLLHALTAGNHDRKSVENYYEGVVKRTPALQATSFNDWIRFLVAEGLVVVTVDGFSLGADGHEFLLWKLRHLIPDKATHG